MKNKKLVQKFAEIEKTWASVNKEFVDKIWSIWMAKHKDPWPITISRHDIIINSAERIIFYYKIEGKKQIPVLYKARESNGNCFYWMPKELVVAYINKVK